MMKSTWIWSVLIEEETTEHQDVAVDIRNAICFEMNTTHQSWPTSLIVVV